MLFFASVAVFVVAGIYAEIASLQKEDDGRHVGPDSETSCWC
jgi:hypothetical protein